MVLNTHTILYPCQIYSDSNDFSTIAGKVVENTQHPGIYGFKNLTSEYWITNKKEKVLPGKGTVLRAGLELDFGKGLKGKIRMIR